MATALETSSQQRTPNPQASLVFASAAAAAYVLASLAVVFYAVPKLFWDVAGATVGEFDLVKDALQIAFQLAALAGLVWLGRSLAGANPPKDLRGGIFLMISIVISIFFLVRAVGMNVDGMGTTGMIVTAVVALGLIFGAVRFLASPRANRWMMGLEHTGFFHTNPYKRSLGQRVRRLTILGILVLAGSGVYSLIYQGVLGSGPLLLDLPFTDAKLTVLTSKQVTIPLLLLLPSLWFAFRIVNMPVFAEFLIATEAEMNKVSWSTRRQLAQDTIVVLITLVLMTLFLFVVDLLWFWLLSRDIVGVLPGKTSGQTKDATKAAKW